MSRYRIARAWSITGVIFMAMRLGTAAPAQEIRWQPISSTGPYTLDDQIGNHGIASEIKVPADGVSVTLEIEISGFGTAPGNIHLGAYQGTLDSNTYHNGLGTDLYADCDPTCLTHAYIDQTRPDFVYFDNVAVPAVSVATPDYEYGSTQMGGAEVDLGIVYYGGTLDVVIPPGAKGTYELGWNPADTKTFFNDASGIKIPGLFRTTGKITVITGKCCWDVGPGSTVCSDELTEAECDAKPGPRGYFPGQECTGPEDVSPASEDDCDACLGPSSCLDNNVCTEDRCCNENGCNVDPGCTWHPMMKQCDLGGGTIVWWGQCYYYSLYDPDTECCDPITGELTLIDDANVCTEDICNPDDGSVDHYPLTGIPCNHEDACVINDECDAGVCVGDLPEDLMIACTADENCPAGWYCNLGPGDPMEGYCDCRLWTPVCPAFDDVCYEEGDPVYAAITMDAGSELVTGGQFLMTYDPTCLAFVSIGPCNGSIFTTVIDSWADEIEGLIWYAVIAYDEVTYEVQGTTGPYDLACLEFVKLPGCEPCNLCLTSDNPYNTLLTNDRGQNVEIADPECCSEDLMLDGEMEMWVPADVDVNADCGVTYAEVLWDAPYAMDECLGPLELDCTLEHDGGIPLDPALIMTGGIFPQGTTTFTCTAVDSVCGGEVTKSWTVHVSNQHTMDVEVHLSPTMYAGEFSRCICFDLYLDCTAPAHVCTVMDFNGPYDFDAHARAEFKIDKGNYLCIEARDPLHTLRSTAAIECIDNKWTAVFKGDPLLGEYDDAHWLVGGNLDFYEPNGNPEVIDVLDFGVYASQVELNVTYTDGNTTCDTPAPHADINADGNVDSLDYAFLVENFLADSKVGCCEEPGSGREPVLEMSLKRARELGLDFMRSADLNGDGLVNLSDMQAYTQHGLPPTPSKVRRDR